MAYTEPIPKTPEADLINFFDHPLKIDSGYSIIGKRTLSDGNVQVLIQKEESFKTAVINRSDLQPMIDNGILLDVSGAPWNIAYIQIGGM